MMQSLLDAGVQKLMESAPKIVQDMMSGGAATKQPKIKRAKDATAGAAGAAATGSSSSSAEEVMDPESANKPKKRVKKMFMCFR